jgi:hypothetical protein
MKKDIKLSLRNQIKFQLRSHLQTNLYHENRKVVDNDQIHNELPWKFRSSANLIKNFNVFI